MSKLALVVVMTVLIGCSCGFAQTESEGAEAVDNSLRAGAWALQFRVSENFTLSQFQGAVISLKHHRTDKTAFRLGLNLTFSGSDTDQSASVTSSDTVIVYPQTNVSNNKRGVEIELQYLRYPNPRSRVNLFIGGGPIFGYERSYGEATGFTVNSNREQTSWTLGLGGQLGVEWFPMRSLSLHAEYGIRGEYTWSEDTRRSRSKEAYKVDTSKFDGWTVSPNWVLFGLSAYF